MGSAHHSQTWQYFVVVLLKHPDLGIAVPEADKHEVYNSSGERRGGREKVNSPARFRPAETRRKLVTLTNTVQVPGPFDLKNVFVLFVRRCQSWGTLNIRSHCSSLQYNLGSKCEVRLSFWKEQNPSLKFLRLHHSVSLLKAKLPAQADTNSSRIGLSHRVTCVVAESKPKFETNYSIVQRHHRKRQ